MKKSTVILIWAAITGIVSVIFYRILYATGQEDSALRNFNYLIIFLGLFIGTIQYRNKANGGFLTFGEGYKAGILMTLIITVIVSVAFFVDLQIHPDLVDKIRDKAQTDMINNGVSADQIEMRMKYTRMFTTPAVLLSFAVVGTIITGAIFSLITAGISTKKKPIFDDDIVVPGNETTTNS